MQLKCVHTPKKNSMNTETSPVLPTAELHPSAHMAHAHHDQGIWDNLNTASRDEIARMVALQSSAVRMPHSKA